MTNLSPNTAAEFFALVLLGASVALATALAREHSRPTVGANSLVLIMLIGLGATAGSLYFSESADFVPCEMCWFQRIAMYSAAAIAVLAVVRRDRAVLPYLALLATLGLVASGYHIGLQQFPDQATFCDVSNPCSSRWVEAFGWMTIPTMAAISFALMLTLAMAGMTATSSRQPAADETRPPAAHTTGEGTS